MALGMVVGECLDVRLGRRRSSWAFFGLKAVKTWKQTLWSRSMRWTWSWLQERNTSGMRWMITKRSCLLKQPIPAGRFGWTTTQSASFPSRKLPRSERGFVDLEKGRRFYNRVLSSQTRMMVWGHLIARWKSDPLHVWSSQAIRTSQHTPSEKMHRQLQEWCNMCCLQWLLATSSEDGGWQVQTWRAPFWKVIHI